MKHGSEIRFKIHNILYDIYKLNINLNQALINSGIKNFNDKDIALINNVCLNAMRYQFHVKKIIDKYIRKKSKINQKLLLLSAITQIVFLDFKDYAVIDCSVEISKKINVYHGLINASLKKISKDKKKLNKIKIDFSDLPEWFQGYTNDLTEKQKGIFVNEFFKEPSLHIVFKNKKSFNNFEYSLKKTSPISGFLKDKVDIFKLPSYNKGEWWIQDYSSSYPLMKVPDSVIAKKNIDLCGAPGGKSFQILAKNKKIIINDKNKKRLEIVKKNLTRLNYNTQLTNKDIFNFDTKQKYNFIILDSPCSSLGTIRKNPEIFFKKKEPNVESLAIIQKKLLKKASDLLHEKGIILYMVCSFLKIETRYQIENFLKQHKNFVIINYFEKKEIFKELQSINHIYNLPTNLDKYKIDGYFAIYLKKIKNEIN